MRLASQAPVTGAAALTWQAPGRGWHPFCDWLRSQAHGPPGPGRVLSRKQASRLRWAPENRGQGCPSFLGGGTVTRELRSPLLPQFPWRTLPERDSVSWWCPSRPFRPTCQLGPPVRAVQGSEGLMSTALTFRAGALASVASHPSRWPHKRPSGRPMAAAAIPGLPLGFGSL